MPRPMLSLLIATLAACTCLAQEAAKPVAPPPPKEREPVVVSLKFDGGTLAAFVERVRACDSRVNIVLSTEAARAEVPPIELSNAGLDQVVQAVASSATADYAIVAREHRGGGERVYTLVAAPAQPGGTTPRRVDPADRVVTQVFSLNPLTDVAKDGNTPGTGFAAPAILSAIETAIDTTSPGVAGVAPLLRYHPDSGLLIVRATREQIETAKDVLGNLENDVTRRRQTGQRAEPAAGKGAPPSTR